MVMELPESSFNFREVSLLAKYNIKNLNKMEQKPLSELTEQELQAELKKRKQSLIFACFFVGISIGVAVWSATHKGGFLLTLLPLLVAYFFRNTSKEVNEVKKEMDVRKIAND
jgi:lipopolysaccharide export LptBFGC system permease protein LptF